MSDRNTRLNAALEGRYAIERELGEGGIALAPSRGDDAGRFILVQNFFEDLRERVGN